ncbi:MAG: hypothetical protein ABIS25_04830 [Sphingomicrobium sp.]
MDAPLYPPAIAFEQPVRLPRLLDTRAASIAELKAIPAVWAIVLKESPSADFLIKVPMLKPHLGNFSFYSLVQFGAVKAEALDRIDVQLRTLGPM